MKTFATNENQQQLLLCSAQEAIRYRLETGNDFEIPNIDDQLAKEIGACFVTLTINGELRACIESLEVRRKLIEDVCSAALHDPRFYPLRLDELERVRVDISVLSPLQEISFNDERDLLDQIVPFEDGLVLHDGTRRATFLPLIWKN